MPIIPYVFWVGASLLALLFLADAQLPRPEPRVEPPRHYEIKVASQQTGPVAVRFSGQSVSFGPPPPMLVVDLSAAAPADHADAKPKAVEQAMAQLPEMSSPPAAKPRAAPRKRVARRAVEPERPRLVEAWSWPSWQRYQ